MAEDRPNILAGLFRLRARTNTSQGTESPDQPYFTSLESSPEWSEMMPSSRDESPSVFGPGLPVSEPVEYVPTPDSDRLVQALETLETVAPPDAYWYMDEGPGVFDRLVEWQERRNEKHDAPEFDLPVIAGGNPRRKLGLAMAGLALCCAALGAVIGMQARQRLRAEQAAASSIQPAAAPAPAAAQAPEPPGVSIVSAMPSIEAGIQSSEAALSPGDTFADSPRASSGVGERAGASSTSDGGNQFEPTVKLTETPPLQATNSHTGSVERKSASAAPEPSREGTAKAAPSSVVTSARPPAPHRDSPPVVVWTPSRPAARTPERPITIYEPSARVTARAERAATPRAAERRSRRTARTETPERTSNVITAAERRQIDREADTAFQREYRDEVERNSRKPGRRMVRAPGGRRDMGEDWRARPQSPLNPRNPNYGWD